VFTKTDSGWHESGELAGSGSMAHDWFGDAVAISGNTIVVGAPSISVLTPGLGRAYVFTKTASGWHEIGELAVSGTTPGGLVRWPRSPSRAALSSSAHQVTPRKQAPPTFSLTRVIIGKQRS